MILLAINYEKELNTDFYSKYQNLEIKAFNENKGSLFAAKLLKHIYQNNKKYKLIIHFGTCGSNNQAKIGDIYLIERTFLFYKNIIDNQKFKKADMNLNFIKTNNIVTKFSIGKHSKKLHEFANIFDLETFWVAQISSIINTQLISIKGVSDQNDIVLNKFNQNDEINFLLNPEIKKNKLLIQRKKLIKNIEIVNQNFIEIFDKIYKSINF